MIKLVKINKEDYPNYRSDVIFNAYKWDPQVDDYNTISEYALVIDKNTANYLEKLSELLTSETINMEEEILNNPKLFKDLGLPWKIIKILKKVKNYNKDMHIRLMRFDFHPTSKGWMVSEVNSDVPGGYAEASVLPEIACNYLKQYQPYKNFGKILLAAFKEKIKEKSNVALVHATSYTDDRQVMQFFGDLLSENNYHPYYIAPDLITWKDNIAYSKVNQNVKFAAILRFFPAEWLVILPKKTKWQNYFFTNTPSCNQPIVILTQSKRLPLIWDKLKAKKDTWIKLLPKTIDPREVKKDNSTYIYKPALGRVGEGITIKNTIEEKELKKILKTVKRYPKEYIAQEMFESIPLKTDDGKEYHCCIGVFTVNGKCAGFYGRINEYPKIDSHAKDIPVLIMEDEK